MLSLLHVASGMLAHAYFKGKNSTDERKISLQNTKIVDNCS
jgi:hypothetical protein